MFFSYVVKIRMGLDGINERNCIQLAHLKGPFMNVIANEPRWTCLMTFLIKSKMVKVVIYC